MQHTATLDPQASSYSIPARLPVSTWLVWNQKQQCARGRPGREGAGRAPCITSYVGPPRAVANLESHESKYSTLIIVRPPERALVRERTLLASFFLWRPLLNHNISRHWLYHPTAMVSRPRASPPADRCEMVPSIAVSGQECRSTNHV